MVGETVYSDEVQTIYVDTFHKLAIIAVVGKIGKPLRRDLAPSNSGISIRLRHDQKEPSLSITPQPDYQSGRCEFQSPNSPRP